MSKSPWSLVAWAGTAAWVVLLGPSSWFYGRALSQVEPELQAQAWVWSLVTLAVVLSAGYLEGRVVRRLVQVTAAGVVAYAIGFGLLKYGLVAPVSRVLALVSLAATVVAAGLPGLVGTRLPALTAVAVVGAAVLTVRNHPRTDTDTARVITANAARLALREYRDLATDSMDVTGGALVRTGNDLILVSGGGVFHRLSWRQDTTLVAQRLALTADLNRAALRSQRRDSAWVGAGFPLRVNDLAIDTTVVPHRVYVAHGYWHPEQRCLTLRVSVADLPDDTVRTEAAKPWTTVFESAPCVTPTFELGRGATGARLAWEAPGRLLLSVGSHAVGDGDGIGGAQAADNPYGKVVRLLAPGRWEVLTLGHRNPQGLTVARDGRVWSTEHGPQGGDELNLLVPGANYGWPQVTYGVQYGETTWPLSPGQRDHGSFREPVFAFVPSIGVSNLIELDGPAFPEWNGDLMVASMRGQSLFRVRLHGDRVIYVERIDIGERIRDLEQAANGWLVLKADNGSVLVLSPAPAPSEGERAYAPCAACHGTAMEGTPQGPPLLGIVGRDVASVPGFSYSPALRQAGGRWTMERLDAFLRDPSAVVPGTQMTWAVPHDSTRQLILYRLRDAAIRPGGAPR